MATCDDEIDSRFYMVQTTAEDGTLQIKRILRSEYGMGWGGKD